MNLIIGWHYDEGKPIYMPAIDKSTESRRPGWRFSTRSTEVVEWLDNMGNDGVTHGSDHKFNSGDPMYFCHIYDDKLADMFLLRWS